MFITGCKKRAEIKQQTQVHSRMGNLLVLAQSTCDQIQTSNPLIDHSCKNYTAPKRKYHLKWCTVMNTSMGTRSNTSFRYLIVLKNINKKKPSNSVTRYTIHQHLQHHRLLPFGLKYPSVNGKKIKLSVCNISSSHDWVHLIWSLLDHASLLQTVQNLLPPHPQVQQLLNKAESFLSASVALLPWHSLLILQTTN